MIFMSSQSVYTELIPGGVIWAIVAVLFVLSFIVLPLVTFSSLSVMKPGELEAVDENGGEYNRNFDAFSSAKIDKNRLYLKRAKGVEKVIIQIAVKANNKIFSKYLKLLFVDDEYLELIIPGSIQAIKILVVKVNNEQKEKPYLLGVPSISKIVVGLVQALAVGVGMFLFVYSNSGYLTHHVPEYIYAYLSCLLCLMVFVLSFLFNDKFYKKIGKVGK